jgi:hypothetical protein
MSDERRKLVWFWLSLIAGVVLWAAWTFSQGPLALAAGATFVCLNLAYAFRVARRGR